MASQIDGLSSLERALLDKIWAMKTREELATFYGKQDRAIRKKIDLLIDLLKLAAIDEDLQRNGSTLEGDRMLREIGIDV
jgi:hypothetical protein